MKLVFSSRAFLRSNCILWGFFFAVPETIHIFFLPSGKRNKKKSHKNSSSIWYPLKNTWTKSGYIFFPFIQPMFHHIFRLVQSDPSLYIVKCLPKFLIWGIIICIPLSGQTSVLILIVIITTFKHGKLSLHYMMRITVFSFKTIWTFFFEIGLNILE